MTERREFPLTRNFLIACLVTVLLVTAAVSIISSRQIRQELLNDARGHAVRVVQHLRADVDTQFIQPTLARDGFIDLQREDHRRRLDGIVRRVAEAFRIESVYIFDAEGIIQYSTRWEHVGFPVPESNDLFWLALSGEVSSAVRKRGTPLDMTESGAQAALLETYVPVSSLGPGEGDVVANVIEVYQNLDRYEAQIRNAQLLNTAYAIAGAAVLVFVLFWIVRKADRIIRERAQELLQRNQELRTLSQHLESEVKKRTEELVEKERLASLGVLAAGVAHEVNNPLATIASCAQGLQRRLRDGATEEEEFHSFLDLIEEEAFRLKGITTGLLDFSRKQVAGRMERLDPCEVIRAVVAEHQGGDVELHAPSGPGAAIDADPATFRQVIQNVTANALHAIEDRHDFEEGAPPGTVEWTVSVASGKVRLRCRDNGIGFEPDRSGSLLAPFFTTKAPGRGTGLGLALCHSVVQRHKGTLNLVSEGEGKGAEVRIDWPAAGD